MKKTLILALALSLGIFISCKKKDKTEDEPTTPTTTGPTTFEGFKIVDNNNSTVISDSSYCYVDVPGTSGCYMRSYKGEFYNLHLGFKTKKIQAKTYPLDSLKNMELMYGMYGYDFNSGSITFSSVSSTKVSGTFTFNVTQEVGTSTRTQIVGTFNNIKAR